MSGDTATAVERFQKRIVEMMEKGCTGFHFSVGNDWHKGTIEQKCQWALEIWDAPAAPLDFKDSRRAVDSITTALPFVRKVL